MSQKNIDFMKKNTYQLKKPATDAQIIDATQSLISGQMNATDTVVDVEMPNELLTAKINWREGTLNDNLVKITKNGLTVRKIITDNIDNPPIDLTGEHPSGISFGTNTDGFKSILIYDNKLIVGGNLGHIIVYDFETETWETDGSTISNLGTALGAGYPVYDMIEYQGNLIVSSLGRMAYYDGGEWWNYNSGMPFCDDGTALGVSAINTMSIYNNQLIVAGASGRIASHDGTNWKNYDGTGSGSGIYDNNTHLATNINESNIFNDMLVFMGDSGKVASYDGSNWKNDDGTGIGTGPYGSGRTLSGITTSIIYNNTLVIADDGGNVSSYDGAEWMLFAGIGSGTGIFHFFENGYPINKMIEYDNNLFFFHDFFVSSHGKVDYYDGTSWFEGEAATTGYFNSHIFFEEYIIGSNIKNAISHEGIVYLISENEKVESFKKEVDLMNVYKANPSLADFINITMPTSGGLEDLTASIIYDDKLIIANSGGEISYYDLITKVWVESSSATGPTNDGTAMGNERITSMVEFNGSLVVAGSLGRVASYDGTDWKNYDGTLTGTGPFNDGAVIATGLITNMVVFDTFLVICSGVKVSSFDGTNWKAYDGTLTGLGPYNNGTAIDDNISGMTVYNDNLILGGDLGKVSSYDGTNWKKYDGTLTGTGPYFNGGSGITKAMMEYEGYLVVMGELGIMSCDSKNNWTDIDGTGDDQTAYLYATLSQLMSQATSTELMEKYNINNPSFDFYQDKNNQFLGQAYTNLVLDPNNLTTASWPRLNVTPTVEGGTFLGDTFTKVALTTGAIGHVSQNFSTEFINLTLRMSILIKKGNATNNACRIIVQNSTTTNAIFHSNILLDEYPSITTSPTIGSITGYEWYDEDTVRIFIECAPLNATTDDIAIELYPSIYNVAGEYTYFSQVQLVDSQYLVDYPFVDGTHTADVINKTHTMPDKFHFDMIIEPKFSFDTIGDKRIFAFSISASQRFVLTYDYTLDKFLMAWEDGGVEALLINNKQFDDGTSYDNINQRLRVFGYVNVSGTGDSTYLGVVPLETGTGRIQLDWDKTPNTMVSTINNLHIGNEFNTNHSDSNIEYLRIYDGGLEEPIRVAQLSDVEELFPPDKLLFHGTEELANFDGTSFNRSDSGAPNTFAPLMSEGDALGTYNAMKANNESLFLLGSNEKVSVIDLNTDSYSVSSNKITHK